MENLTINALLDRVREVRNLKSDYQIHKAYGISVQKLANWRHGRNLPDESSCQILAEAAGLDPYVLIAQVHAMRAQDSGARAIWQRIAERLQMVPQALAIAVFSALFATSFVATDAHAQGAQNGDHAITATDKNIHRI